MLSGVIMGMLNNKTPDFMNGLSLRLPCRSWVPGIVQTGALICF